MIRNLLPLAALVALAACGKADGELNPGNWKSTMKVTSFEVPGAPPEMQKLFKEQVATVLGQERTAESCMTPEQAKAGVRDFSKKSQGECTLDPYTQGGGKMSGTLTCKAGMMADQAMRMEGTYNDSKVDMTMSADINRANIPGGKATITMSVVSERTGDCKK